MPEQQQNRPQEQVEKKDALAQSPEDQARQQKATEVKDKYEDDSFLEKGKEKAGITPEQARDTLSDPAKLQKFLKEFEQSRMEGGKEGQMRMMKPEHVVREMLDLVKGDNDLLKKIIQENLKTDDGFVTTNALEMVEADDAFFKMVYENAGTRGHVTTESLKRIEDQEYKTKMIFKGLDAHKDVDWNTFAKEGSEQLVLRDQYYSSRDAISTSTDKSALNKITNDYADLEGGYAAKLAQTRLKELEK